MSDESGKLAKLGLRLSELEFDKVYCAGIKHQSADAFSRLPTDESNESELNNEIPVLSINPETFGAVPSVETEQKEAEVIAYGTPQQKVVPFIRVVYSLADKTEK